jgi:hypothetical protein
MKLIPTLSGRGLALVALAILTSTATAYAATAPAPGANTASVSIAGADRTQTIGYGRDLRIAGAVTPGARGTAVRLEHRPRGGEFRQVAQTQTRANGSYEFSPTARTSGSYRALAQGAAVSAAKRVTVVGKLATRSTRHVFGGRPARVRGTLMPREAGRAVRLQLRSGRSWRTVDRARTGRGGRFNASWRPRGAGVYRLRVRSAGDRLSAAAVDRLTRLHAYRAAHASYYGPGLYGNRLACGGTLTTSTLGVAHKYLPCGTRVTFRYRGRSVRVPVVDRGPFIAGREWDLTEATKNRLGFGSTGTVWSTR